MIKNFLKGIVFGTTVGAISGLLFAPRSGNETRKKLIAELDEATELNNSLNNFKQALVDTKETANTLIPAFQESMKKDIENFKFQAEPRIAQIQEQVEKLTNDLPQDMQ